MECEPHVSNRLYNFPLNILIKVEKASVVMFQHLIVVNNLKEALEMEGIYDDQLEFIKTLIDSSIDVPDAMVMSNSAITLIILSFNCRKQKDF